MMLWCKENVINLSLFDGNFWRKLSKHFHEIKKLDVLKCLLGLHRQNIFLQCFVLFCRWNMLWKQQKDFKQLVLWKIVIGNVPFIFVFYLRQVCDRTLSGKTQTPPKKKKRFSDPSIVSKIVRKCLRNYMLFMDISGEYITRYL